MERKIVVKIYKDVQKIKEQWEELQREKLCVITMLQE